MGQSDFYPENIQKTAFFTGHRILSRTDLSDLPEKIFQCLSASYDSGYRRFFCGCALGFDTLAAFETVRLRERFPDVQLLLAIPCETQSDRWQASDRETYRRLLSPSDDRVVLSPSYYKGVMMTRNRYMADRSSLCICFLRNMRGGTASTVRYALLQDRIRVINLAVPDQHSEDLLRESTWSFTFTSHSAGRNAVTAPLRLSRNRKLRSGNIYRSFIRKP